MEGQENQSTNNVVNNKTTNSTGAVTQTAEMQNKTEGTVIQTVNKTEGNDGIKTFTQEEVNAMLAKEKKKMPDAEKMKAFEAWQEAQKTEGQRQQEEIIKNQKIQEENNFNSQIIEIMKKGLDYETAEFVQFKVSKMDGNFIDNLETYLKEHPQTTKTEEKKNSTTGFSQSKITETVVNEGKDYLDKKYANNPYYKK